MAANVGYTISPYSRMATLANEVFSKELRPSKLKPTLQELFNTDPNLSSNYNALVKAIINRLKKCMEETFAEDKIITDQEPKLKRANYSIPYGAERYSSNYDALERIERALERVGITPPPSPPVQQTYWPSCIIS